MRSQVHQTRGLTRKRNALLKSVFKGAATTVIALLPDDPLRMSYERALQAGMKPNLAKLTLARRPPCCRCGRTRRCTTRIDIGP